MWMLLFLQVLPLDLIFIDKIYLAQYIHLHDFLHNMLQKTTKFLFSTLSAFLNSRHIVSDSSLDSTQLKKKISELEDMSMETRNGNTNVNNQKILLELWKISLSVTYT